MPSDAEIKRAVKRLHDTAIDIHDQLRAELHACRAERDELIAALRDTRDALTVAIHHMGNPMSPYSAIDLDIVEQARARTNALLEKLERRTDG